MRFLSLLLALAVVATGCDGTDPVETFSGPTIEFAAASAGAAETDTTATPGVVAEVPITLANGVDGQVYTVEVLYAAGASTVDYGDDVDGFGEAAGANRVAVATLTGPADTTTVSIRVIEDGIAEAAEAVVFVLQAASNGARIGDTREFRLEIGTPPISEIRTRDLGAIVTVEGVVTRARGRFSWIQDDSGAALATFAPSGAYFDAVASGEVRQGDRIQIVGELTEFNGLLQVSFIEDDFEVLSRDNDLPAAVTLTVAQILGSGDEYESELVRVLGLTLETTNVVFSGNTSYDVTDATGTMILRTSGASDSEIVNEAIAEVVGGVAPAYGPFDYVGPVGQFGGTNQLTTSDLINFMPVGN